LTGSPGWEGRREAVFQPSRKAGWKLSPPEADELPARHPACQGKIMILIILVILSKTLLLILWLVHSSK